MARLTIPALLASMTLLAGCGSPDPGTAPDTAPAATEDELPAQLADRSFETASPSDVTGYELAPDSALTLTFYRDHQGAAVMGGSAGCNGMGGTPRWDGATVRVDDLAQTEMYCDNLMDQEQWWAGLLTAGLELTVDGDRLRIVAADENGPVRITMVDAATLHPDQPLLGTTWRLDGLADGAGTVASAPADLTASLTISRQHDGQLRLDVFNGLTWLSTPGGVDAATGERSGQVVIEPADDVDVAQATAGIVRVTGGLAGDGVGCPADRPDCFVDMTPLGADFEFRTDRDTLTVTGVGDDAGPGLIFVADPDAPTPDVTVADGP